MKRTAWAWLALNSLLTPVLDAATRPHYGGTLAAELSGSFNTLDPVDFPAAIANPISETLLRFNPRGEIEPWLAVAWQVDADRKRWRFSLRPKVTFHDGEPLNGPSVVPALLAALKKKYPDVAITAGGQAIMIRSDRAMPDLLRDLTDRRAGIVRQSDGNPAIGTGPFRVAGWEPGRRLTLKAFDDYWGGRPFLDAVTLNLATPRAAERAAADLFDIPFSSSRLIVAEGRRLWLSPARELVALIGAGLEPQALKALALAIDREPVVNVLTQRRGEAAFGLLPEWLSGYAFLFRSQPDLMRARQIATPLHLGTLTLTYPAGDLFARAVAERISLNARDAGINLQPTSNAGGNLALVRWRLESADAASELARVAALLGAPEPAGLNAANPTTLYDAERALVETQRVIPLVFLPVIYGLAPRVHEREHGPALHLENLWVDP